MNRFIPQNFNDLLALVLIAGIMVIWILTARDIICLPAEVVGALIATWTLIVQYYFRKKPDVEP
jgi:hypothetical protein